VKFSVVIYKIPCS